MVKLYFVSICEKLGSLSLLFSKFLCIYILFLLIIRTDKSVKENSILRLTIYLIISIILYVILPTKESLNM